MTTDIEPSDWSCLDPWWDVQPRPAARNPSEAWVLERDCFAQSWSDLDSWRQLLGRSATACDPSAHRTLRVRYRST
jgi:hypothetical protein